MVHGRLLTKHPTLLQMSGPGTLYADPAASSHPLPLVEPIQAALRASSWRQRCRRRLADLRQDQGAHSDRPQASATAVHASDLNRRPAQVSR